MKKALTLVFASLLCSASCIEALAFRPETVETVKEVTDPSAAVQTALAEEDENTVDGYLKNDPAFGTLYYYNNFNDGVTIDGSKLTGQTYYNKKLAGEMLGSGFSINGPYALTLEDAASDSADKALKITASGALSWPKLNINSQYNAKKLGIYTLVFDCKKNDKFGQFSSKRRTVF